MSVFSPVFIGRSLGLFLFMFLFAAEAQAQDCWPQSYQELVRCAVKQSSEIQIADQQLKAASHLEGTARQWLNPEFEADSVHKGSDISETTASLLFDIRLGGKRAAAINEARAQYEKTGATHDLTASQAKLDLILRLYRLSHLKGEIKIEEESVSTFTKIVNQYQRKAALSPEQEVSLSVFRMALGDHQLSLTKLKSEEEKIIQELIASTKLSKEAITKNLPARKTSWPEISYKTQPDSSPHIRFAKGELMEAKSLKEKADADAWPDLKIGPAVKVQRNGGGSENHYGLALSVPLPIFSLNGSGRSYGTQKLIEAEMNLSLSIRKVDALKAQLQKKYESTVVALKSSISAKIVEEKHERIERHFFKGLVPSSLVIEAHRQLVDFEKNKNESEREAIEALGSIYIINSEFSEVIL